MPETQLILEIRSLRLGEQCRDQQRSFYQRHYVVPSTIQLSPATLFQLMQLALSLALPNSMTQKVQQKQESSCVVSCDKRPASSYFS